MLFLQFILMSRKDRLIETIFWETKKLVIGSFLQNGFEATLGSKMNRVSIWKGKFLGFLQFLNDEAEIIFWKSKAECLKLFKSKSSQRNLLRKWFRSFVELKNQYCGHLKIVFFIFLFLSFWLTKLKPFPGKVRQSVQNYLNQYLIIGSFLKNDFEAILNSQMNVLGIGKGYFSVFWKFFSDEVETNFWESETEFSRPIKSKVGHRKLFRK